MSNILSLILFTPLAGAILLLFVSKRSENAIKWIANLFAAAGFLVSIPLWFWYNPQNAEFQFVERAPWIPSIGADYFLGVDGFSTLLILLTTMMGFIAVLSSWTAITERVKEYYIFLLVLQTGMLGAFMSLDFLLFFLFWEVMLVPMYFLIGIWGSANRLYSAIKFFLYTLVGSVVMLLGILALYFSIDGIIYGALVAMAQRDWKRLVAYSSVSHMAMVMLGMFALNPVGITGSIVQQLNHGISTGALFLLVGVVYERRHTREISEYGGLSKVMPVYAAIFLLMTMSSIGLPALNGFIGELLILQGIFAVSLAWAAVAAAGIVLGAAYMLWLYQRTMFGKVENPKNQGLADVGVREFALFVPLIILAVWIGLYPSPFLQRLDTSVARVIARVSPQYQQQA